MRKSCEFACFLALVLLVGSNLSCGSSSSSSTGGNTDPVSSAKAMTSFSIVSPAANGIINESAKTITVNVPYGTNLTALVATFITTGANVKIGPTIQISGSTSNNYTSAAVYSVSAVDGTSAQYIVNVEVAPGVISTYPANNDKGLSLLSVLTITFSKTISPSSIKASTIMLTDGVSPVLGTFDSAGSVVIFTPNAPLVRNTTYTATITTGVKDLYGNAVAPNYSWNFKSAWTIQTGSVAGDGAMAVAVDDLDNILLTGVTGGSFDGHASNGGNDIFVAKYDAEGNKTWSRQIGTSGTDSANGIAVDSAGDVYVAGCEYGKGATLNKLTSSGTTTLSTTFWSGGCGQAIALDSQGNIYMSGSSNSDKLVKANSTGIVQWSINPPQLFFNSYQVFIYDLALDSSDNVYFTGSTNQCYIGGPVVGDSFIAKYDANGTKLIAECRSGGSAQTNAGVSLEIDRSNNNITVVTNSSNFWRVDGPSYGTSKTGYSAIDSTLDASGNIYLVSSNNADSKDVMLTKIDSTGSTQWEKHFSATHTIQSKGVSVDVNGNIYVVGQTFGSLDGNINADSVGISSDAFVVKFDSAGDKQ